jgi:hypothetical protein
MSFLNSRFIYLLKKILNLYIDLEYKIFYIDLEYKIFYLINVYKS